MSIKLFTRFTEAYPSPGQTFVIFDLGGLLPQLRKCQELNNGNCESTNFFMNNKKQVVCRVCDKVVNDDLLKNMAWDE